MPKPVLSERKLSEGVHQTGRVPAKEPLLLRALKNEPLERPPVWMMRQAGRYLHEYQEMKSKHSFLELCKTPDLACEITMQPMRILRPDAAIIFADILLPAEALGLKIDFQPGPKVYQPIRSSADVDRLQVSDPAQKLSYVCDAMKLVRHELDKLSGPQEKLALLGFAGAPWTMACYLIDQGIHKHFQGTRIFAAHDPSGFCKLLDIVTDITETYLLAQLASGADAVQLFDSWSGNLSLDDYRKLSLPWTVRIIETVHRAGGKIILYGSGSSHLLEAMQESGADCLSLDWKISLEDAFRSTSGKTGARVALQGNLDPCLLFAPTAEVVDRTERMLQAVPDQRSYIANLGHGILPGTPRENALAFVETVRRGWPKPKKS